MSKPGSRTQERNGDIERYSICSCIVEICNAKTLKTLVLPTLPIFLEFSANFEKSSDKRTLPQVESASQIEVDRMARMTDYTVSIAMFQSI